ncbi:MAG: chromate transporter [Firmicutes bacterium]|nr:chromate transporter [Bacillota bacterium]MDD7602055.1 chromate transporter [Bacillota bacterium]MDY5856048.1 chromate transporter [Anaerovoracaceae bacterium]
MTLIRLFYEFLKIGLFSVGGGMATLPFLYAMADNTGWFTYAQIADMLAVSESTPGPIGINMATYVGYTTAGIPGALAATIGIIIPGIVLVLIITAILDKFRNNVYVEGAFYGLRPASVGLITAAGILVVEISLMNTALYQQTGSIADLFQWKAIVLAALLLVLTRWVKKTKGLHPVYFIVFSAVVGIVFHFAGV